MTGKVLVVDDDPLIRASLVELLEDYGYEVVTAEHGKAMTEMIDAGLRPCVVLLDLMMPIMDGREVLRRLHGDKSTIPIVIITAYNSTEALEGSVGTVTKPFDLNKLIAALEKYCGKGGRE
jgi:CheY-like chemotaxis protein